MQSWLLGRLALNCDIYATPYDGAETAVFSFSDALECLDLFFGHSNRQCLFHVPTFVQGVLNLCIFA